MHMRRTPKAVVGLATAVAALFLMALPASANPYAAEITDGDLDVYELFEVSPNAFASFDLSDSAGNIECPGGGGSITFGSGTTTGSVSGTITSVGLTEIPPGSGDFFLVVMTINVVSGTWTDPDTVSGTLEADVEIYDVADTWPTNEPPCDIPVDEPCTISADNIAVSGTYAAPNTAPNGVSSITISGSNSDFETTVSGPAEDCGVLVAIDNGHVELRDVEITLT